MAACWGETIYLGHIFTQIRPDFRETEWDVEVKVAEPSCTPEIRLLAKYSLVPNAWANQNER